MKKALALTILTSTLLSTNALALTQKINLDMGLTHLRGQQTIRLKQEARMQTGIGLAGWKLKKVQLVAKSKHGQGSASILVNNQEGPLTTVPGTPELFRSTSEGFSLLNMPAPTLYRGERARRMQILTQGNIKVKNINMVLKKKVPPRLLDVSRLPLVKVASLKADKLVGSTKTIHPRGLVKGIAITGKKGKVIINKVTVIKANGQKIILDEIKGSVKKNRTKGLILPRDLQAGIVKIKVSVSSANLFGSRGKVDIKLAQ